LSFSLRHFSPSSTAVIEISSRHRHCIILPSGAKQQTIRDALNIARRVQNVHFSFLARAQGSCACAFSPGVPRRMFSRTMRFLLRAFHFSDFPSIFHFSFWHFRID